MGKNGADERLEFLVHARQRAPEVPRVMVTAFPDVHISIRAINEGRVSYFFLKPVEAGTLLQTVHEILTEQRSRERRSKAFAGGFEAMRHGHPRRPTP